MIAHFLKFATSRGVLAMLLASSSYSLAQTSRPALTTLYTFTGGSDGSMPSAGVIFSGGVLYGTTLYGGPLGYGAVYSLSAPATPSVPWTENTLYSFTGGADGAYPAGGVTLSGGMLYGTTGGFGSLNTTGAVYSLAPPTSRGGRWTEANLYSFPNRADGTNPQGAPSIVDGPGGHVVLYGTTSSGGGCPANLWGCGTLFALTPPGTVPSPGGALPGPVWTEAVIHRFDHFNGQPAADGLYPNGTLAIREDGVMFGATYDGGNDGHGMGYGMVFSFVPPGATGGAWTQTDIYDFGGPAVGDGVSPSGGVALGKDGVLYGTTQYGGVSGAGTVYSLTPPASSGGVWTETVLYSFAGGRDGQSPSAGVAIGPSGILYGTTVQGGISNSSCYLGCGTVFSLAPPAFSGGAWTKTTLFQFTGGSDGYGPYGGLLVTEGGMLFGTTEFGGSCISSSAGCGTVFALQP